MNPAVPLTPADAGHLPALGGQSSPHTLGPRGARPSSASAPPDPEKTFPGSSYDLGVPGLPLSPCFCYLTREFCHRTSQSGSGYGLDPRPNTKWSSTGLSSSTSSPVHSWATPSAHLTVPLSTHRAVAVRDRGLECTGVQVLRPWVARDQGGNAQSHTGPGPESP